MMNPNCIKRTEHRRIAKHFHYRSALANGKNVTNFEALATLVHNVAKAYKQCSDFPLAKAER